ncbi:MAG: hypothetical protein WBL63_21160 [Candidatus Acidiferrum sp.]
MKRLAFTAVLSLIALSLADAQSPATPPEFFPLTAGTYWVYKGTVRWDDPEGDKPGSAEVTWKMTVEKVIRKKGLVAAIVTGFPADLDWSAGATEAKPWLILEDDKHKVYYENLSPDFDLSKIDSGDQGLERFLVEDNFFFQWPLHSGAKFCDAEAKDHKDNVNCWVVADAATKKLDSVKGAPGEEQAVYRLEYRSPSDETVMEVVSGVGLLSYQYHHHGSVADTEMQLVEFHRATHSLDVQGPQS